MRTPLQASAIFLWIILFSNYCINAERDPLDYTTPGGQIFNSLITPRTVSVNVTGYNVNNASGTFIPLIMQLNNADDLSITQDGTFQFSTNLNPGQAYNVTVFQQPDVSMICTVSNATGAIFTSDITNIDVLCEKEVHSISGSINGLNGDGLTLRLAAGGQTLNILKTDTAFSFTDVPKGTVYDIAVVTDPTNLPQTCTVTNAAGTVQTYDISGVVVNCTTFSANISGTINNTSGSSVNANSVSVKLEKKLPADASWTSVCNTTFPASALANNTSAAFDFGTSCKILAGYEYLVTVNSPSYCSAGSNSGTIAASDITNVQINCTPTPQPITGTLSGLTGSNLVIRALVTPTVGSAYYIYSSSISAIPAGATSFTLPSVPSGSALAVSIYTQPNGAPANIWQTCTVSANANIASVPVGGVSNIGVSCTTNNYNIIVNVTGTVDTNEIITLSLNGGAGVNVAKSSFPYTLTTTAASGVAYNVGFSETDPDFVCSPAGPFSVTIAGTDASVAITCYSLWKEISIGVFHTIAIRNDNTLWGWGRNANYELTSGIATTGSTTPKKIGTASNWVQVSAGFYHSAARNSSNQLFVWGYNNHGQVGDGSITTRQTMFQITAGGGTFSDVSAGAYHTMAINTSGQLYAWGWNNLGQLCLGNYNDYLSPALTNITGGLSIITSNYVDVEAGLYHTILRRSYSYLSGLIISYTNSLWGCGYNGWGQLGLPTSTSAYPSGVLSNNSNWTAISAGNAHSLAIAGGQLYGAGYNYYGQLGLGNNTSTISAWTQIGTSSSWTYVDAGYDHSSAVLNSSYGYTWGYNVNGELARGTTTNTNTIGNPWNLVLKISGGYYNSARIGTDGKLYMTGYNYYGTLGTGNTTNQILWTQVW